MLKGEHSAVLSTFNKVPFVIKIFVLSIFEWLFYTGFTVCKKISTSNYVQYFKYIVQLAFERELNEK